MSRHLTSDRAHVHPRVMSGSTTISKYQMGNSKYNENYQPASMTHPWKRQLYRLYLLTCSRHTRQKASLGMNGGSQIEADRGEIFIDHLEIIPDGNYQIHNGKQLSQNAVLPWVMGGGSLNVCAFCRAYFYIYTHMRAYNVNYIRLI